MCDGRITVVFYYTSGRICYNAERKIDIMGSRRNLKRTFAYAVALVIFALAMAGGTIPAKRQSSFNWLRICSVSMDDSTNGYGSQMRMEAILPERMEDYLKFFGKKRRDK